MSDFLASVALYRAMSWLEDPRIRRFTGDVEVLSLQELYRAASLGHVHHHRPVRLSGVLSTQP